MRSPESVLHFWFGPSRDGGRTVIRPEWFVRDLNFEAEIAANFDPLMDAALHGYLEEWAETPRGALALILVLDQFPRKARRGRPISFAGDALALALAKLIVNGRADVEMSSLERIFVYQPYKHAESLSEQHESVRLFRQLAADAPLLVSQWHCAERQLDLIQRFGRFPHRNEILGRISTPAERVFLSATLAHA